MSAPMSTNGPATSPAIERWAENYVATIGLARRASRVAFVLAGLALVCGVGGTVANVWYLHDQVDSDNQFRNAFNWWASIGSAGEPLAVALMATGVLIFIGAYLRLQVLRWESDELDDEMLTVDET